MIAALLFALLAQASNVRIVDKPKPVGSEGVIRILSPEEAKALDPILSVPCKIIDEKTAKCAPSPVDAARIEVAQAVVAVLQAERAEALAERDSAAALNRYLNSQRDKFNAAAALEAAKKKLPGWKPGALLTPDFRIAEEEK